MITKVDTYSSATQRYYEKVAVNYVDKGIRDQVIEIANQVADEIIKNIDIKKLVISKSKHLNKDKVIVALQFEKKK